MASTAAVDAHRLPTPQHANALPAAGLLEDGAPRILLDGVAVWAAREGQDLVAADGRRVAEGDAVHLPPCQPTKIIGVHVNFRSRDGLPRGVQIVGQRWHDADLVRTGALVAEAAGPLGRPPSRRSVLPANP